MSSIKPTPSSQPVTTEKEVNQELPSANGNNASRTTGKPAKKGNKKRRKKGRKTGKRRLSLASSNNGDTKRRGWTAKPYPTATFESVLPVARTIFDHAGASREMKRATIFDLLARASESGPGRTLVTNSGKYGLTLGGYKAEVLKLTEPAIKLMTLSTSAPERTRIMFQLAIQGIPPFSGLYEKFKGGRLPAIQVMVDAVEGVDDDEKQECVELFVGNLDFIGLLNVVEGAQLILDIDTSIDSARRHVSVTSSDGSGQPQDPSLPRTDFETICFFMAPIGNEDDEERKHSDMVLSTLVNPALRQSGLTVIRADQIVSPGMISKQIIEYIWKSRLVIVDLSYHNPNVFYELAIRHLLGKPTVHIVKKSDGIPFDIGNFRTIELEDLGYDFIAKIETHKVTIANYVREALDGSSSADNPILSFFPELQITLSVRE